MESIAFVGLEHVEPVQPPAKYIGGKRNLAKLITAIIERVPHSSYNEPFVGMGGIFFRRARRPRSEAINDISGDVVTLFRILREHYPYFVDMLKWRLSSRADFKRLLEMDPAHLTDLQRAARFLYLQRLGFGGKVDGRAFGVDARQPARFDVVKLEPMLADLAERLSPVTIEQLPFAEFIGRYDHAGALFYLDPPYWGCEGDYGPGVFGRDDFAALAEQLRGIEGRFILSINDRPDVRLVFDGFEQLPVETTYSFASGHSGKSKRVGELIISNLPRAALMPPANDD
jgi:DNA adenine methylase